MIIFTGSGEVEVEEEEVGAGAEEDVGVEGRRKKHQHWRIWMLNLMLIMRRYDTQQYIMLYSGLPATH